MSLSQQGNGRNGCAKSLRMPRQYEDVHMNPDSDCYVLQVTTLNFIFTPVVMGMTLSLASNSPCFFACLNVPLSTGVCYSAADLYKVAVSSAAYKVFKCVYKEFQSVKATVSWHTQPISRLLW